MIARTRISITLAVVCHVLLAVFLLTSGLHAQETPETPAATPASAPEPALSQPTRGEPVTIQAREQEKIGNVYHLRGDVQIDFRTYTLKADDITYNSDTGDVTATGHVDFSGGPHDEHLAAARGTYNLDTDSGRFYDVTGTTGAKLRGKNVVLTSSNPFSFTGTVVDKEGRDKIIVHHGTVTSCTLPRPKWAFHANEVTVVAGEDAKIYNTTFWLWRFPIFYFPFMDHPVEHLGRKSGFLLPSIGQSSRKGTIIGDSFYWAINHSADATIGAEYYSSRGWAQQGEFRARPSETSFVDAHYFGVLDRGIPGVQTVPGPNGTVIVLPGQQDQGGREVRLSGEDNIRPGLRAVADIDYLSSFIFRAAFAETFTQAINSEVRSTAFLSDNSHGYSFNAMTSRYQNFQSINRGDVITIVHAPSFEASTVDRQLGHSPFYWNFDAAAEGLSRREPNFVTKNVVGRYDLAPQLSMPLFWHGWTFRPDLVLRNTFYTDSLVPSGTIGQPAGASVNRHSLDGSVELRPPTLSRIFAKPFLNHEFKHTIEPRVVYHYTTGVESFPNILRFDERDILSDTNEVEYALVNRLYAKRVAAKDCVTQLPAAVTTSLESAEPEVAGPIGEEGAAAGQQLAANCASPATEVISWEVAQKYFFDPLFGGALVSGRPNVFTTTEELTGIAFLTEPRRFSPVVSRLRMRAPNVDAEWQLDYDTKKGRINSSIAGLNYKFFREFYVGGGHAYLQTPGVVATTTTLPSAPSATLPVPSVFNQFRFNTSYGHPNKRGLATAATVGFDVNLAFLQYTAVQTTYNWDCCGLTIEYRRFALGAVRNENQFRFALSLANIGTFGTLRRQERLY